MIFGRGRHFYFFDELIIELTVLQPWEPTCACPARPHTPATSRAASVSYIKLGGGLFRVRSASSMGVMLRGLLAGFLAGVTVRSPPTLSASRTRLGFFAVSLRRKLRRFCMPTIAESTLTSARLK